MEVDLPSASIWLPARGAAIARSRWSVFERQKRERRAFGDRRLLTRARGLTERFQVADGLKRQHRQNIGCVES